LYGAIRAGFRSEREASLGAARLFGRRATDAAGCGPRADERCTELLLLDEPSMGLSPVLVRDIFLILVEINQAGKTILLVEQNANMFFGISPAVMFWKQAV